MGNNKFKFVYEVRLNDEGRPYIHLPDEYESTPEHLFMAYELVRFSLFDLMERGNFEILPDKKEEFLKKMGESGHLITQISDELAAIIKGQMGLINNLNNEDNE